MKQEQVKSVPMVIVLATTIIGALEQFAAAIGLHHITKAIFEAATNDLVAARDSLASAKVELAARRQALRSSAGDARSFVTSARDVLKNTLGKQFSPTWETAGFRGSFEVPTSPDKLQAFLQSLKTFFTNNQPMQVAQLEVTAEHASTLLAELAAAQLAVNTQLGIVRDLATVREEKLKNVLGLIRTLLDELSLKLDPLDGEWLQFGFKLPGAVAIPDVPQNVMAVLIGPSAVAVKWDGAARAEHYRVWKKVSGVDLEWVAAGSPADLDFTVEGLPANSTIEIAVSAVNNGGESQRSETVSVVTH